MLRDDALLLFLCDCCCFDGFAGFFFATAVAAGVDDVVFGAESESLLSFGVTNGGDCCSTG